MKKQRPIAAVSIIGLAGLLTVLLAAGGGQSVQKKPIKVLRDKPEAVLNRVIDVPLSPGKPDLCLEGISIEKPGTPSVTIWGNVSPGEAVVLSSELWNMGAALGGSRWWKVGYYIDGVLVGTKDMSGLGHGRGPLVGYACSAPLAEGLHYYECRLDLEGVVDEGDKRNNRLEIPFHVGPPTPTSGDLPDLIIKDIRLDGTRIEVWVQNLGGKLVTGTDVLLYVNGNPWNPPVYRGGTSVFVTPGGYLVFSNLYWKIWFDPTFVYKAVVDPSNQIAESNESNNSMSVRFTF